MKKRLSQTAHQDRWFVSKTGKKWTAFAPGFVYSEDRRCETFAEAIDYAQRQARS